MKTYKKGETTVIWNAEICTHSAVCAKGLPSVFQPKNRPWINVEGATEEEIKAQVRKCPSGALSLKED